MIRQHVVWAALAAVAFASSGADAQTFPPGSRPPVVPASSVPAIHPLGVPGLVPVTAPTATPSVSGGSGGGLAPVAAPMANSAQPHHMNRPKGTVPPPPAVVDLQSGINATMGIAYEHTNRILTPFEHPEVKTNSTAAITVEGSIVYVSTNADDPISMFIHDHDRGDPAISLTLVPEEIPAVSTQVRLPGLESANGWGSAGNGSFRAMARAPSPASAELAHSFETSNPYVETLIALMKDLAHQRVPDGYSLQTLNGASPLMPQCSMPGLRLDPAQLLSGGEYEVLVARASNVGVMPVSVREDGCGEAARAVAAWPDRLVQPGASTEVYIVLARANEEGQHNQRPTVAGAR